MAAVRAKAVIAVLLVLLFFDPVRTVKRNITQDLRFLVLTDNSSSGSQRPRNSQPESKSGKYREHTGTPTAGG